MIKFHAGRVSALLASALVATACGDDKEPMAPEPTVLKVRLENIAPFAQLKSGTYTTRVGGSSPGPLAPGDAFEFSFTAGKGQKLSFASMLGQSNDWVFATPPGGIELYEGNTPVQGDITSHVSLWDVGTEINEEPAVGAHTLPNQGSSVDGPGAVDPDPTVRRISSPTTLSNGSMFNVPAVSSMIRVTLTHDASKREFTVRIENVSNDASTLQTSQGYKPVRVSPGVWALSTGGEPLFSEGKKDRVLGLEALAEMGLVTGLGSTLASTSGTATPVSPGLFLVHSSANTLFKVGAPDSGQGLERIAEEGNVTPLYEALKGGVSANEQLGTFTMPEGSMSAGPAKPGDAYTFEVSARPGDRLTFVTMFGMSNDWFFGTTPEGIELFNSMGEPVTGDLSTMLHLYDAGTEINEEPGIGANTGPQQATANTGPMDPDPNVRELSSLSYGTPVANHLKLTISR
ncbi:spondin domain-containing protein [Hyalangium versicolor]|uniref:spondin domain-containing protein n=1 Tax=Hyalangium versicolor TaxID=2861190 RepID=UPI001CCAF923|nr:spondin domain-containing protein [Hyalangium versicolor]